MPSTQAGRSTRREDESAMRIGGLPAAAPAPAAAGTISSANLIGWHLPGTRRRKQSPILFLYAAAQKTHNNATPGVRPSVSPPCFMFPVCAGGATGGGGAWGCQPGPRAISRGGRGRGRGREDRPRVGGRIQHGGTAEADTFTSHHRVSYRLPRRMTHAHANTHLQTHTHTHTRMHACMHARAHTHQ